MVVVFMPYSTANGAAAGGKAASLIIEHVHVCNGYVNRLLDMPVLCC